MPNPFKLACLGLAALAIQSCASGGRRQRDFSMPDIEKRTLTAEHAVAFYPVVLEGLEKKGISAADKQAVLEAIHDSAKSLSQMRESLARMKGAQGEALRQPLDAWNDAIAGFSAEQKGLNADFERLGAKKEDISVLHYGPEHVESQLAAEEGLYARLAACAQLNGNADFALLKQRLAEARAKKAELDALALKAEHSQVDPKFIALLPEDPGFKSYKDALSALKRSLREHRQQKAKVHAALEACAAKP